MNAKCIKGNITHIYNTHEHTLAQISQQVDTQIVLIYIIMLQQQKKRSIEKSNEMNGIYWKRNRNERGDEISTRLWVRSEYLKEAFVDRLLCVRKRRFLNNIFLFRKKKPLNKE